MVSFKQRTYNYNKETMNTITLDQQLEFVAKKKNKKKYSDSEYDNLMRQTGGTIGENRTEKNSMYEAIEKSLLLLKTK